MCTNFAFLLVHFGSQKCSKFWFIACYADAGHYGSPYTLLIIWYKVLLRLRFSVMLKKGQIATAAHHFEVLEENTGRQWQFLHNFTNALLRIEVGRAGPFENFDHGLPYNDANVWTIIGDRLRDDFDARKVVWNWEHFSFFPSWWLIFVETLWRKKKYSFFVFIEMDGLYLGHCISSPRWWNILLEIWNVAWVGLFFIKAVVGSMVVSLMNYWCESSFRFATLLDSVNSNLDIFDLIFVKPKCVWEDDVYFENCKQKAEEL